MTETNHFFESVALWSQVAGAVAFLIVIVLLFRKLAAPALASYEAAKNAEIADAEAYRQKVHAQADAARAEVTAAEADAAGIRTRIAEDAERERAALLAEAKDEGERTVRSAEGELERSRASARDQLRIEFIEKALAKARVDAQARIDAPTNTRLVGATVDDLVKGGR